MSNHVQIKEQTTHYTDRPDNKETPPKIVEDPLNGHIEGSEHHPARHGRHTKSLIDHAIELEDKIEEIKHDVSKETKKGHLDKAHELDKELSEVVQERENIPVEL